MLRILVPPEPLVTPADVPGTHAADDPTVAALIQAATGTIDGPLGWLGRCLGEQTLELSFRRLDECWREEGIRLPYKPIIEVEGITYLDTDGAEHALDDAATYLAEDRVWLSPGQQWPSIGRYADAIRIRYLAGYDGRSGEQGGTGNVPEEVRQAIIVSATHLLNLPTNLFLSSDTVEGVGTQQYVVSEQSTKLIEATCDRLLQHLKVYA